jgi:hypothetical protein
MWRNIETAALATAFVMITSIAAAQPATIRLDSRNSSGADAGAGTTVFHGAPAATGNAAVVAGGTTVFHGTPGGPPSSTGSSAAKSPPSGAGR